MIGQGMKFRDSGDSETSHIQASIPCAIIRYSLTNLAVADPFGVVILRRYVPCGKLPTSI